MAKRPTKQQTYNWIVYHIAARQKFVGYVHDQSDSASAIKTAIIEYNVPPNERGGHSRSGGIEAERKLTPAFQQAYNLVR